ncbi:hypothetical protein CHARACLAT_006651 [Characodon lateralis]|uniref:Uncharacterized protein n=1 Tax=Characodon lateralis TaxID=208331 RepID=A0ABU7EU10_9TELE|nr:hypothetical protein [Characodon lateralis]
MHPVRGNAVFTPQRRKRDFCKVSCLMSSDEFPRSLMIWWIMSSDGVGPLCFMKSKAIYKGMFFRISRQHKQAVERGKQTHPS